MMPEEGAFLGIQARTALFPTDCGSAALGRQLATHLYQKKASGRVRWGRAERRKSSSFEYRQSEGHVRRYLPGFDAEVEEAWVENEGYTPFAENDPCQEYACQVALVAPASTCLFLLIACRVRRESVSCASRRLHTPPSHSFTVPGAYRALAIIALSVSQK